MRLKAFGIGAAAVLAVGGFTVASGVHTSSVFASCSATGVSGTTAELDGPAGTGCLQVGVGAANGVVYSPVGGTTTSGVPGAYVIVQGEAGNPVSTGYVGVSNYESGAADPGTSNTPNDPPCGSNSDGDTSTNSGGSVGIDNLTNCNGGTIPNEPAPLNSTFLGVEQPNGEILNTGIFLVAPVACGQQSGASFSGTARDGCWEP